MLRPIVLALGIACVLCGNISGVSAAVTPAGGDDKWEVQSNWDLVKNGMTEAQVKEILGEPKEVHNIMPRLIMWTYGDMAAAARGSPKNTLCGTVSFQDGKVATSQVIEIPQTGAPAPQPSVTPAPTQATPGKPGGTDQAQPAPRKRPIAASAELDVPAPPDGLPGWYFGDRWKKLTADMSEEEVIAWLGEPAHRDDHGNLIYGMRPVASPVQATVFADGRVQFDEAVLRDLRHASAEVGPQYPRWFIPATWFALRVGMTPEEVEQQLGAPDSRRRAGSTLVLEYTKNAGGTVVTGTVTFGDADFPELSVYYPPPFGPIGLIKQKDILAAGADAPSKNPDFWRRLAWRFDAKLEAELPPLDVFLKQYGDMVARDLPPLAPQWEVSRSVLGLDEWRATLATNFFDMYLRGVALTDPGLPTGVFTFHIERVDDQKYRQRNSQLGFGVPQPRAGLGDFRALLPDLEALHPTDVSWRHVEEGDVWLCTWKFGGGSVVWSVQGSDENGDHPALVQPIDFVNRWATLQEVNPPPELFAAPGQGQMERGLAPAMDVEDPALDLKRWHQIERGDGVRWVLFVLGQPKAVETDAGGKCVWRFGPWTTKDGKRFNSGTVQFESERAFTVLSHTPPKEKR
jgi:hypothetical protein